MKMELFDKKNARISIAIMLHNFQMCFSSCYNFKHSEQIWKSCEEGSLYEKFLVPVLKHYCQRHLLFQNRLLLHFREPDFGDTELLIKSFSTAGNTFFSFILYIWSTRDHSPNVLSKFSSKWKTLKF